MTERTPSHPLTATLPTPTLARVLRLQAESHDPIDVIVARLGLASETEIADTFAAALNLPRLHRDAFPAEPVLPDRLRPAFLRPARAIPVADTPDGLVIAMADPSDQEVTAAIAYATARPVLPRVALASDIERALDALYQPAATQPDASASAAPGERDDLERLRDLASDAPVIRMVNRWINQATEASASDIHIEPAEDHLMVRIRIDGVLTQLDRQPAALHPAVVSRLKIMAHLDIAERRLAQDGAIGMAVRGRDIDIRVSVVPTVHGESVVLRILDSHTIPLDFPALGFTGPPLDRYLDTLRQPHGIVLVTGPTGSGKTTTLYASLRHLRRPGIKILTVEDPVEYRLDGINQTQVEPRIGLDFAAVLRSFLRHDPDVVLVGEVRDGETARIAVRAALTGRLVLSTLHTNDAASAIARLADMGVENYLITATVTCIVAQRLVRRLCEDCRAPFTPSPALCEELGLPPADDPPTLWQARGCEACHGKGYRGRAAIHEVLLVSEAIRSLVMRQAPATEIQQAAIAEGMESMYLAGLRKALAGVTSVEEVIRVTRGSSRCPPRPPGKGALATPR